MNVSYGLPVALLGAAVVVVQAQGVRAIPATEVNKIARQITVRIDGQNTGSGVIVQRQGNTYFVLTNWHVVETPGRYELQTADGKQYAITNSQVRQLPKVDLAILRFNSNQEYPVANIGRSDQLREGEKVFVAGWADPDAVCLERCYRFPEGLISGRLPNARDGYGLVYSNVVKPGMSGGPVLNEQGQVVGINGQAIRGITGVEFFGIPTTTIIKQASEVGYTLQLGENASTTATQFVISGRRGSTDLITSNTISVPMLFTFTGPSTYANCLQDILQLYEDQQKFKQQGRSSECLPEVFRAYTDTGLSKEQAIELIKAADNYSASANLTLRLYPPGGMRTRITQLFGFTYEIDRQ